MESIDNKIVTSVKKSGRGCVFFADKFARLGSAESIRKALSLLVQEGTIIRVARGIYSYPKVDNVLGLGIIYPTIDEIAQAIGRRDKARIVPTGIYALNLLGLSEQVPMNYVYLTDGGSRDIEVRNGRTIRFKHTAPKNLAFQNKLAMLVCFALREIGQANITETQKKHIQELLRKEDNEKILRDLPLMPIWVREIVMEAYDVE